MTQSRICCCWYQVIHLGSFLYSFDFTLLLRLLFNSSFHFLFLFIVLPILSLLGFFCFSCCRLWQPIWPICWKRHKFFHLLRIRLHQVLCFQLEDTLLLENHWPDIFPSKCEFLVLQYIKTACHFYLCDLQRPGSNHFGISSTSGNATYKNWAKCAGFGLRNHSERALQIIQKT